MLKRVSARRRLCLRTKAASRFWQKRRRTTSFRSTTQSTIRYPNPTAGRLFGYELDEMLWDTLTSLMPERLRQIHLNSVRRYLSTGQRHVGWRAVELIGLHKSGREFPIEVSFGEAIHNGRHFFIGIVEEALRAARLQRAKLKDLRERYHSLTVREREVMAHVVAGMLNKQVANELGTTAKTIKVHPGHIIQKMGAKSFGDLSGRLRDWES
ncbi:MAG: LuxR C-terminal-related transcriptional regulator [Chthoniobacterales bacterium]